MMLEENLEGTLDSPAEDKQFLADLEKSCATKDDERDERCKSINDFVASKEKQINSSI